MKREEIIKALRCCNSETRCSGCPFEGQEPLLVGACAEKILKAAADMLEQDAPGWISVKDRLPEPGEQVLLIAYGWSDTTVYIGCLKHMEPVTSWLTGITSAESEWHIQGWSYLKEPVVTHWMPLPCPPELPKEEGK